MRILYIDIDSQRPDHLGCYGYHRDTSPTIDAIARDGIVFDNFFTPDAPCLPSRTAFYSGRFGIQTGVVGHGGTAAQPKIQDARLRGFKDAFENSGLARQLQLLGHHTAMISPFGQRHAAHWFHAGFHEVHNPGKMGLETAEDIAPIVLNWLDHHIAEKDWYLHVNFWDPHTPYRTPASVGDPFASDPLPAWLDDDDLIRRHLQVPGPHSALELGGMYDDRENPLYPRHPGKVTNRAEMRRMIDGYDTGVRYMDGALGGIVDRLKSAGVYEEMAIVISGDHGENLGELGIYAEHATADVMTCRIPMIFKYPGGARNERDGEFHYNLDLAPTLMELLGGETPRLWDGKSFAAAVHGGKEGRDEVVLSQCCHVCQRSVRWDNWLYMRTYHDGFRLFPTEMLFDLKIDPHEQNDVAAGRPELCREGAWRLNRWHDAQMEKMAFTSTDSVDPLWTVIREGGPHHANLQAGGPGPANFQRYLTRLEDTGRAAGAAALRAKYAHFGS